MVSVLSQPYTATEQAKRYGGLLVLLDARQIFGVLEGGAVSTWSDLSGGGRHFTPEAGDLITAPVWRKAGLNGRPSVEFNGTSNILSTPAVLTTNEWTIFAVASLAAQISDVIFCQHTGVASAGRTTFGCGSADGAVLQSFYNDGTSNRVAVSTATAFDSTPRLLRWVNDALGNSAVGVNGSNNQGSPGAFPYTPVSAPFDLGGLSDEGVTPEAVRIGANWSTGQISWVSIANKRWSDSQIMAMEQALCREFGIRYR